MVRKVLNLPFYPLLYDMTVRSFLAKIVIGQEPISTFRVYYQISSQYINQHTNLKTNNYILREDL